MLRYALPMLGLMALLCCPARVSAESLEAKVKKLVAAQGDTMRISVTIHEIESGQRVSIDGAQARPLASVFKLPLLTAVVKELEQGRWTTQQNLSVRDAVKCIGSGRLYKASAGTRVTVDKLLRLMMSISDNTATDMLFEKLGRAGVDRWMSERGLKSSRIFLTNREAWLLSLGKVPGWGKTTPEQRVTRWRKLNLEEQKKLADQIRTTFADLSLSEFQRIEDASARSNSRWQDAMLSAALDNQTSTDDLATLLVQLWKNELYAKDWTDYTLEILAEQRYHTRLPARLPREATVYHKTGTLAGMHNDAGLLVNPKGRALAVAVSIHHIQPGKEKKADGVIAEIARLAYEELL